MILSNSIIGGMWKSKTKYWKRGCILVPIKTHPQHTELFNKKEWEPIFIVIYVTSIMQPAVLSICQNKGSKNIWHVTCPNGRFVPDIYANLVMADINAGDYTYAIYI
jgi:hypothetical protein